jgi:hypothetical protein
MESEYFLFTKYNDKKDIFSKLELNLNSNIIYDVKTKRIHICHKYRDKKEYFLDKCSKYHFNDSYEKSRINNIALDFIYPSDNNDFKDNSVIYHNDYYFIPDKITVSNSPETQRTTYGKYNLIGYKFMGKDYYLDESHVINIINGELNPFSLRSLSIDNLIRLHKIVKRSKHIDKYRFDDLRMRFGELSQLSKNDFSIYRTICTSEDREKYILLLIYILKYLLCLRGWREFDVIPYRVHRQMLTMFEFELRTHIFELRSDFILKVVCQNKIELNCGNILIKNDDIVSLIKIVYSTLIMIGQSPHTLNIEIDKFE